MAMSVLSSSDSTRNRVSRWLAIPLLLVSAAGLMAAEPARDPAGPPADRDWKLVWSDEFDGAEIDPEKWIPLPNQRWDWPGIPTKAQPDHPRLDGQGNCVVELTRDPDGTVRNGRGMVSRFWQAYGYFEARVQFSTQPGWWAAVWLSGYPYACGVDTFRSPQEFDFLEDFYKPKQQNDISQAYHCSIKLEPLPHNQGNARGVGDTTILQAERLGRTSAARRTVLDDYSGWHVVGFRWTPLEHVFFVDGRETYRLTYRDVPVTNVPLRIYITGEFRTPKGPDDKPFYGRLEEANLPDRMLVDYVRVYEEDAGPGGLPQVTLAVDGSATARDGEPVTFRVAAAAPDRKITDIMLFSMGRLRAEQAVETVSSSAEAKFTVTNLFPNALNTVVAMARDDAGFVGQSAPIRIRPVNGREFTGTPYQGAPQAIPGTVRAGLYDEGGNEVAFSSSTPGPSDSRLEHRTTEIGDMPEAVGVGEGRASWITYEIDVAAAGEYDAELFMNRCDVHTPPGIGESAGSERVVLNLGSAGSAGEFLAAWPLPTTWNSGYGWRHPQKSVGVQRVRLPAGRHKLVFFGDEITIGNTFFCKLVVTPVRP